MGRTGAARTLVAVIGIGETEYYRHRSSPDPEFKLALKAILSACKDAGLDPREIDGFASYDDDRSEASGLAAALGTHRLRTATMQWGAEAVAAAPPSPMPPLPSSPVSRCAHAG
jgi:hypothetical protein